MFKWSKLSNHDFILSFLVILLGICGLVTVFSTTYSSTQPVSEDLKQQMIFFVVGIGLYLLINCLDVHTFSQFKLQLLLAGLMVLLLFGLLLVPDPFGGPRRWLYLGSFSIQPSEFAKIIIVTLTASAWARRHGQQMAKLVDLFQQIKRRKFSLLNLRLHATHIQILTSLLLPLTIIFLIFRQPSLGNALITLVLWLLLLSTLLGHPFALYGYTVVAVIAANLYLRWLDLSGLYSLLNINLNLGALDLGLLLISAIVILALTKFLRLRLWLVAALLIIGLTVAVAGSSIWQQTLSPYQRERVVAFLNPEQDPLGAHWQLTQSKIAIASGQIFGKGLLQGTQVNLGLLPFAYTDFAYAAFVEQFGLLGSWVLITLFALLISRVVWIGTQLPENFGRLTCFGIALLIGLNAAINIGMNLGLMPVTGVPLPFISYGGSAVIVNLIGLGLVQMLYSEYQTNRQVPVVKLTEAIDA